MFSRLAGPELAARLSFLLQAVGKLSNAVTLAAEFGDEAEIKESQANWRETAATFWSSMGANRAAPPWPKLQRLKILRWLMGTTMQLISVFGRGWSTFAVPEKQEDRADPLTWRSITLNIDQGSDGWSASYFLAGRNINLVVLSASPIGSGTTSSWLSQIANCGTWPCSS